MKTFTDNFTEALTLFKEKYAEKLTTQDIDYNSHLYVGEVGAYFAGKEGNVNDFAILKYRGIEITRYSSDEFNIKNILLNDDVFDYNSWIYSILRELQGDPILGVMYFGEALTKVIEKEVIVEVEKINYAHKAKADLLDQLLQTKNLTN